MVVSDTSPLNYLILIKKEIDLLPQLYSHVLVPDSGCEECRGPGMVSLKPAATL
jgi:predicted nucleic acid-binding protein